MAMHLKVEYQAITELFRKAAHLIRGVVHPREKRRYDSHDGTDTDTAHHREEYQFDIRILGLFHLSGSQELTDNNRHGIAQSEEYYVKKIGNRG